jgi:hypothetical protein
MRKAAVVAALVCGVLALLSAAIFYFYDEGDVAFVAFFAEVAFIIGTIIASILALVL